MIVLSLYRHQLIGITNSFLVCAPSLSGAHQLHAGTQEQLISYRAHGFLAPPAEACKAVMIL
jgi:hypothetical protein